jgi:cytochrome c biogenesis protein CcmG, thiol:disulfide interchange protein DsbE
VKPLVGKHPTELRTSGSWRRRRWLVAVPLAIVLVLVTWMLAFGLTKNPDQIRSVMVGRRAPDFALRTLDGSRTLRLSSLRGQVVVVNFWGSWCADCAVEHPALAAAWNRYRDQGVTLVGVLYQDPVANAEAFLRTHPGTWPEVTDPRSAAAIAYGVRGAPETFFISPNGRIAAWHSGPISYGQLSSEIDRLLGRGATA